MINFNQPHLTGKEAHYMYEAVYAGKLSGNGRFTKACQAWFEQHYGFRKCLLTTSGTDALEMCAMLCDLHPGDEVIVPSYTFVSTALAFLREGAMPTPLRPLSQRVQRSSYLCIMPVWRAI